MSSTHLNRVPDSGSARRLEPPFEACGGLAFEKARLSDQIYLVSTVTEIEEAIGRLDLKDQLQLLRDLGLLLSPQIQDLEWLQLSQPSFDFWENEDDTVYDDL
jgi:hypothetical protein